MRPILHINPLKESFEYVFPKNTKKAKDNFIEEFTEFWDAYPLKKSRGAARKAFAKARQLTTQLVIMRGTTHYAAFRTNQDPSFTKHPATWLNQECWGDEIVQRQDLLGKLPNTPVNGSSEFNPLVVPHIQRENTLGSYIPEIKAAFEGDLVTMEHLRKMPLAAQDVALRKLKSGPYGAHSAPRQYIRQRGR